MIRYGYLILAVLLVIGCSTDQVGTESTLEAFVEGIEIELDNVIACAASNENDNSVSVFLYPREGATNIQYFETENSAVNKNDFANYTPVTLPLQDVFNGFLKKFELASAVEKWVIITFDENGKTHLSNPIRLKQRIKPTEYLPQNITVDTTTTMPYFSWEDGAYDDTKIYFQVVSDAQNNLLSGTYTFERLFRYYELDNVVLNVTKGTPPELRNETTYGFSLLAVSEDNWVNQFSEIKFQLQ